MSSSPPRQSLRLRAAAAFITAAIAWSAFSVASPAAAIGTVSAPAIPSGVATSSDFTVTAAGQAVGLFDAGQNGWGKHVSFGRFDMTGGPVTVSVTVGFAFTTAKLVPASLGLVPARSGQTLTFTLDQPRDVTLVLDDDYQGRTLHLFAQAPEVNPPSPTDPNVIYYGPGLHVQTGAPVFVPSGKTLYLAPGAVLRARIRIENATGATVRGHGVLLSDYSATTGGYDDVAIAVSRSQNVAISGITTNRSVVGWTGFISESSDVRVSDYHVVSPTYASTDGFDINNSNHVTFQDVFIRACDDAVSIKGYAPQGGYDRLANPATATPNHDISYVDSQLWSDANNAIVVGEETIAARYEHITFRNIDVLQSFDDRDHPDQLTDRAALTVLMFNATSMSDIVFDDIRVEHAKRLINVDIRNSLWFDSLLGNLGWPGSISGVTFSNITSTSPGSNEIRMIGWDAARRIDGVQLKNVKINGTPVASASDPHLRINSLVTNLSFVTATGTVTVNGPIGIAPAEDWTAARYDAAHDYTPQQGNQGWNYRVWKAGVGTQQMTWSTSEGRWRGMGSWDALWTSGSQTLMHPDGDQILMEWTAPRAGTVSITGQVRKWDTSGGDGITASIWKNGTTTLWPVGGGWQTIAASDGVGVATNTAVTVAAGDVISFRVDGRATTNNDTTAWTPRITYQ
ncbi:glycosyl hydrolase family 28 protein [Microbacterium sp. ZW T5_56]|uniref:glycosyl hydrolase family 28 protein n=1 Tax=Microbacterium sp. ZW T5_56 TaxID=3378081 RepID=UPI003852CF83